MTDDDPIKQHIIEQEAARHASNDGGVSYLEAIMARISASVTADALRKRPKQVPPPVPVAAEAKPGLYTIESVTAMTLADVASRLHIAESSLDNVFGVVLIDPVRHLYIVKVVDEAPLIQQGIGGPYK